tara:strand:- start:488 stop:1483 length:996 start_codon:yes stop_codon:yes gene_type:complete
METSLFDYNLPESAIAQTPVSPRDSSRLLVDGELLQHKFVRDLPSLVNPGDFLVLNNTRVMRARLNLFKKTGGSVEVLVLNEIAGGLWEALIRPSRKVPPETVLYDSLDQPVIKVKGDGESRTRIVAPINSSMPEIMTNCGDIPLPPYIEKKLEDSERYQTVFSEHETSVAAPTAGLHLTQAVLDGINQAGAAIGFVELSVGLGTFRPIDTNDVTEHEMHEEYYRIDSGVWKACAKANRVIAIGTTVVRALESAAITGDLVGKTNLFISPGFEFRLVQALLTNFHLPRSSLLVMIEAFVGTRWRELYQIALDDGYRFLSFGDAMFLQRKAS